MITEDYVSFETAKLLKEKGFEDALYGDRTIKPFIQFEYSPSGKLNYFTGNPKGYPAPTLQMAMKWLTEAHNTFISPRIEVSRNEEETGIHQYGQPGYYVIITYVLNGNILPYQGSLYPTPEEACETAIKYCLENLILKL